MPTPGRGAAAGRQAWWSGRRRSAATCAAALLAALAAGCAGPSAQLSAARGTASTFARSVADGDTGAICRLLTRSVVESLEQSGDTCPQAVQQLGLDDPGTLTGSQVWGSSALVTFTGGDVFLTDVDGRWRVTAAGCTQHAQSPADCDLEEG